MIEINGWISICATTDGENKTEELDKVVAEIEQTIQPLLILNQFLEIKFLNGSYILFIGLNHNHDIGYCDSICQLLNEIGGKAIGSYGLVYARLHDDVNFNTFKVLKLARGKVTIEDDKLLSPCNPNIED